MLLPRHLADLRRSGLSDQTIADAGVYSETDPRRIAALLNWRRPATVLGPCCVIPYRQMSDGAINGYARLRPDNPRPDGGKYEGPRGTGNKAYFPLPTILSLRNPLSRIGITEGEKKAMAACQAGLPCIGLAGVWAWQRKREKDEKGRGKGERELIEDLARIDWYGREVWINFDTDPRRNPLVAQAKAELTKVLCERGVKVYDVVLPVGRTATAAEALELW